MGLDRDSLELTQGAMVRVEKLLRVVVAKTEEAGAQHRDHGHDDRHGLARPVVTSPCCSSSKEPCQSFVVAPRQRRGSLADSGKAFLGENTRGPDSTASLKALAHPRSDLGTMDLHQAE